MPGLNGTGPEGKGSLTGRKMGNCRDSKNEQKESKEEVEYGVGRGGKPRGGRGFGRGRRGRFGRGRWGSWGRRSDNESEQGE